MDLLTLAGVVLAFAAVLGGNWMEGGELSALFNGPAMVIVLGGSIGAILLQTPMAVFMRAMRMVRMALIPPDKQLLPLVKKIVVWSNLARREGLLALERVAGQEPDLFVRKGIRLLVDGHDPVALREALELELESRESLDLQAARVFEGMGGYAPTIGIIGAVMGLIQVMQNLADPSKLGSGIAAAFVATIYGVGLANLFLIPLANKLKQHVQHETRFREVAIEGLVAIADGDNPRHLEGKLMGLLH
jgi:chemotaxis protein MotA